MKWVKASEIKDLKWTSETIARFIQSKKVHPEWRHFLELYPDRLSTVEVLDESPSPDQGDKEQEEQLWVDLVDDFGRMKELDVYDQASLLKNMKAIYKLSRKQ